MTKSRPRGPNPVAEMIDSTRWGDGFSWRQLVELSQYMELREYSKGEIILREGERNNYMTLVIAGVVAVNKGNTIDIANRLAVIEPGRTFGEMSLLDGGPRSASVIAATDVKLLVITEKNFSQLLQKTPALGLLVMLKIAKLLSQRLRRTSGRLVDFHHED